mgnify:CR=1 FL=1
MNTRVAGAIIDLLLTLVECSGPGCFFDREHEDGFFHLDTHLEAHAAELRRLREIARRGLAE